MDYKEIKYGSTGDSVIQLQKMLNSNGYKLDEDGIYGNLTQEAVRDYQSKNNLTASGIADMNTWNQLSGTGTTSDAQNASGEATQTEQAKQFSYTEYSPSESVTQAQQLLNQQMSQKPGGYQSQWGASVNETIEKILNRQPFSYDLNEDALYQQYADQYVQRGKLAMMDTMGQAQAMTGGYGNSYAQMAGQQAYQGYLQQLNDVIPELYAMALDRYQMEGDALADQYALLASQEEQEYSRYNDQLSAWQSERDRLEDSYNAERDYDYSKWADERDFAYDRYVDEITGERWQAEFDEDKRRYDQEWAAEHPNVSGGNDTDDNGGSASGLTEQQEADMENYVLNMLNNAAQNGSAAFDPARVINTSTLFTAKEGDSQTDINLKQNQKQYALEVLDAYLKGGYMK